jgi:hypothetical protein
MTILIQSKCNGIKVFKMLKELNTEEERLILACPHKAFNAGIKSLCAIMPDQFLLGILLLQPCISLIYA